MIVGVAKEYSPSNIMLRKQHKFCDGFINKENKSCSLKQENLLNREMNISFKGTPIYMNLSYDSLVNYNRLSNGSYLDIHDDIFAPQNKDIRRHNLSFLDYIYSLEDKKKFIENFERVTKFPDLKAVSENIEDEFKKSIMAVSQESNNYMYEVVAAGYDETCSVGKRKALPGSDLDKSFIIIKGDIFDVWGRNKEKEVVDDFKGKLWAKTDQRILSYNHDTSFPTVMTVNQVRNNIRTLNEVTKVMNFDRNEMSKLVQEEYSDLIKASKFNIILARYLPKKKYDHPFDTLNKENVKNFAYFIESVRDGKKVITSPIFDCLIKEIENSDFYKYSNVAQMKAMKNAINSGLEQKTKISLRKDLEKNFKEWPIEKQFDFVKTLIMYSCEDETKFMEYFNNDRNIKELYKPLLGLLCYGDEKRRINPEFVIGDKSIDLFLSKDNPVKLYQGFSPNVLWIDSGEKDIIEDVLLQVDKLKKTKLFQYIDRVQAPMTKTSFLPEKFYGIDFFTSDCYRIMERML